MILPVYLKSLPDETLFSWIHRLKDANGISSMATFFKTFIDPQNGEKYPYFKTDGRIKVPVFYEALEQDQAMSSFFLNMTCYGALAPLISTEYQIKQLNASFRPTGKNEKLTSTPASLMPDLNSCPICRETDLQNFGHWYYHRSHQLPGVYVCQEHRCLLEYYVGAPGHEFEEEGIFHSYGEISSFDAMFSMAVFAKNLLDLRIDASMEETKAVITTAIKEQGYYAPKNYKRLEDELRLHGLSCFFDKGIKYYLEKTLMYVSDAPIASTIAILLFLFGSAPAYAEAIQKIQSSVSFAFLNDMPFTVQGTPTKSLLELVCNDCGYRFCTTAEAIKRGWGCPQCDSKLSAQELFERIVQVSGNGEYTVLSSFQTMEKEILMSHSCGREYKIKPRKFIHNGTRCTCEGRRHLNEIQNRLNLMGDFSLMTFSSEKQTLGVIDNTNDELFSCSLDSLNKEPWRENAAPRFNGSHELFLLRVEELVGTDYTVVSQFKSYREEIMIRHNECGQVKSYYPHNFLHGQRCGCCRPLITKEFLRVEIPRLSAGEYAFGGVERKNMIRIINVKNHQEIVMSPDYALQELYRPTPSRILPIGIPSEGAMRTDAIKRIELKKSLTKWRQFMDAIHQEYGTEKFIFLDEFAGDPDLYKDAKGVLQYADSCNSHDPDCVKRLYPGIYAWPRVEYTVEEMLTAKYCRRKNSVIGFIYGQSFAYELGLNEKKPDKLYFTTIKESAEHGRPLKVKGVNIYVRGSRIPITNENYKILQLLDFLPNMGQYISCPRDTALTILSDYAKEQGISKKDVIPYLHLYPSWVPPLVDKIFPE